jgi:hypothetical protein
MFNHIFITTYLLHVSVFLYHLQEDNCVICSKTYMLFAKSQLDVMNKSAALWIKYIFLQFATVLGWFLLFSNVCKNCSRGRQRSSNAFRGSINECFVEATNLFYLFEQKMMVEAEGVHEVLQLGARKRQLSTRAHFKK